MRADAEEGRPTWAEERDPRATGLGRLLRLPHTGFRHRLSLRRCFGILVLVAVALALLAALDAFVAGGPALGLSALAARFSLS